MLVAGHGPMAAVAQEYQAFARREARGRSAAYEALAEAVAADPIVTGFVASLPRGKWQPNLLFASARYLLGAPDGQAYVLARDGQPFATADSHGTWLRWLA